MALLTVHDELPHRPRRVLVAGSSGSGKSTLARRIGGVLTVPHVELDGLFHGPGWRPRLSFVADVQAFSAGPEWVTEWQYPEVRGLLAARCDLVVWLDLPRRTVVRRSVARTLRRRWSRTVLWNGNVEPPLRTFVTDRDHVVRWAFRTQPQVAPRVGDLLDRYPALTVVRLRRPAEVERWCQGSLGRAGAAGSGRAGRVVAATPADDLDGDHGRDHDQQGDTDE